MKKTSLLAVLSFWYLQFIYAQPGHLDPLFGKNGIVKTSVGANYNYYTPPVNQILPLPDGSMYVVQGYLAKRLSNGSIDSTFGNKGFSMDFGFRYIRGAAVQSDGKIVVVGSTDIGDNTSSDSIQTDYALARYNPDGRLDTSFSIDGKQTTNVSPNSSASYDEAYAVAIQKDGKIIVAGHSNNTLSLARYNTDGSLDNTFDGDGLIKSNISFFEGYTTSIALQGDGKILAAGSFSIVRYNTNGSRDATFSGDETRVAFQELKSIAIQKDGKIVGLGNAFGNIIISPGQRNSYPALGRLNTDGSLDKSFSGDGIQPTELGIPNSLALQNDNKIVTAGGGVYMSDNNNNYTENFAITRYNADGSLDKSFSNDGKQTTGFGNGNVEAKAVAVQSDGKIVAGGGFSSNSALTIARYNTDGSLDDTFDKDGKLIYTFSAGYTVYNRTAIQKDGKIVAVGYTWNGSDYSFVIVRYNTDGSLDNTFSNDGIQITSFTGFSNVSSLAIQNDGKIVVSNYNVLARFNADGSADSTFLISTGQIRTLAIQKDGKILIGGPSFSRGTFEVHRYNSNGITDYTFGKNGSQSVIFYNQQGSKLDGYASSIAIQGDGKILVGAVAFHNRRGQPNTGSIALIRLNTNGSLDNTFSEDGKTSFNLVGASSCSLVIQNDGKIIIGGSFSDIDTQSKGSSFKRYNTDGSIDTGFNLISLSETERSIALQNDGKIVLGGSALIRYNTDGSRDSTFGYNKIQEPISLNDIAIAGNKTI